MTLAARVNPTRFIVVGDMHSLISKWYLEILPIVRKHGIKVVVSTGDLKTTDGGDLDYIELLSQMLRLEGILLVFVDGNHDRHNFLRYLMKGRYDRFCHVRENIWYAPRGLRWNWQGVTLMAAGGAYSIDRRGQEIRGIYEPKEIIETADVKRAAKSGPAQIVVSHDCPLEVNLATLHEWRRPWTRGNSPETDLNRARLSLIVSAAEATAVLHGHYHLDYTTSYTNSATGALIQVHGLGANGERGTMRLVMLDRGQYHIERVD